MENWGTLGQAASPLSLQRGRFGAVAPPTPQFPYYHLPLPVPHPSCAGASTDAGSAGTLGANAHQLKRVGLPGDTTG